MIYGFSGDDVIYGNGGDDRLYGGDGSDVLLGHDGNDDLHGGRGNDEIYAGYGADTVAGGRGNDTYFGEDVDYVQDFVSGAAGNDGLIGGTGFDQLVGGIGNDYIRMWGGTAYGDQGPGVRQTIAGNDQIDTNLLYDYGTGRTITTGRGNDLVHVILSGEHDGRSWLARRSTRTSIVAIFSAARPRHLRRHELARCHQSVPTVHCLAI